ncbi:MAG: endonuclease [bacterium]|nr:endonuclease [bacterium]
MKIIILITAFILFYNLGKSQNVPSHFNFDTTLTNTPGSISMYIRNPTSQLINITSARTLTPQFYSGTNSFSIDPFDSIQVTVFFKTNQNLTYNDFIIFESPDLNYSIVNYMSATAKYPDTLYRFTQGLIDEPLKAALKIFCSTNTNNNYTASRTAMFSTIDDYNNDDTVECVYTGRKVYTTGIPLVTPPQSMNTEHTFPQGFFNQDEPMRSDIHHLYPTDETANSRRNNYDFGYVVSNITWQVGGSKLGNDAGGNLVFETRDQHKGNVARCLFYFLMRYQNYGSFMDAVQENVLRQWNRFDTVDAKERQRENGIQAFQNNRSPFVDHPEFFDRIRSSYLVSPTIFRPEISASPQSINFDTLAVNDTAIYYLSVFNYGTSVLNINSVTSSAPQFSVVNFPNSIPPNEAAYAKIKFRPDQLNQTFSSTLTIANNDSSIAVNVTGYSGNSVGVTTVSDQIPVKYSLDQNYPNPFNPETVISYQLTVSSFVTMNIYNSVGKEIASLINQRQNAGSYSVDFDASGYPSGVYFYTLKAGNFSDTKRMIILR